MDREKLFCHFCGRRLVEKEIEGRRRLFCEHCNTPIYENPVPATCLVVVDGRDRLLLTRRSVAPKIGHWCLPGGFMELGETPVQAAARELKEETGLTGRIEMLLGVTSSPNALYDTVLMVGYLVKSVTGTLRPGDDASAVAYFPFEKLPDIAFESHMNFVRMVYAAGF